MKSCQIQILATNSARSGDRSGLCPTQTERGVFSTASASSGETHGARAAGAMQPVQPEGVSMRTSECLVYFLLTNQALAF